MASKIKIQTHSVSKVKATDFQILHISPKKGQQLNLVMLKVYRAGLGKTRQKRIAIIVPIYLSHPTDWLSTGFGNRQKYPGTTWVSFMVKAMGA
jgi:hypothetical protein